MKNKILTGENWQGRVRSMLGVDAAFLPDTDIEMPEIVQVAEANIIDLVPDYETIPEDKKVYLESATVCECAVLACDSMPARLPVKESGPHVSFELEIDWEKKKIEFAEKRDMHISKLVKTPDVTYFAIS
jgi:hypothetical protein